MLTEILVLLAFFFLGGMILICDLLVEGSVSRKWKIYLLNNLLALDEICEIQNFLWTRESNDVRYTI
jgi:hypothetical protein